jgi:hypothetical protein
MAASPTASCSSPSLPSGDPDLRHGAAAAQGPHLGCLDEPATVGYACSFVVFTDALGVRAPERHKKNCETLTGQLGVVDEPRMCRSIGRPVAPASIGGD